ncbi:MAG: outer membrane beta-barrel protein [Ferruginibacter sp.]
MHYAILGSLKKQMGKILFFVVLLVMGETSSSQPLMNDTTTSFCITVVNEKQQFVEGVSIELASAGNNALIKAVLTDAKGIAVFTNIAAGEHYFSISGAGYQPQTTPVYTFPLAANTDKKQTIILLPDIANMQGVTVVGTRPFIQHIQGKVLINVDAAVTNAGTTVLEVLEKSPGVMIDKNGTISLQAKTGVLVMIDDKPTYLSGTELTNLLGSMSSSQVEQIELMANPSAKYDASGNAGIINIKTKKNKQKGFNGTLTISAGQGRYSKNNNSIVSNYRNGKFNTFLTYSMNRNKNFTDLYALRKYYNATGELVAVLDQPTLFGGHSFNNTIKTGVDYYASAKTTIGISFTGITVSRKGDANASATWKNAMGIVDSAIGTYSTSANSFRNGAINLNGKHVINKAQELSVDVDWLNYSIRSEQFFNNKLLSAGGYSESSRGDIPSSLHILSAKADHTLLFGKAGKLESGWKSAHISTDNLAAYEVFDGIQWNTDPGKSNHFLYKENIHALYSNFETRQERITLQAGLRYEYTSYEANQLTNSLHKDSGFARNYQGLFPSGYISYQLDSSNGFTFTAGRRIDRPAFQSLNPFVFIINKYTYETGNPFILPQYSWNMEVSHQYKSVLTTAVSYSIIKNYFSQLFLTDSSGILIYSEGNVGKAKNLGLSVTAQLSPFKWWSFITQAIYNHKELKGYMGNNYASSINQLNLNINNQFRINKIYTVELSGFYTTRARNDLQELLYPTGQLSAGIVRPVLKKKGTLKISIRDIFFTQTMEGLTQFQSADEYFIIHRDSRVINLAFTWRFGKPLKQTKRTGSGAGDEMERAGNGT